MPITRSAVLATLVTGGLLVTGCGGDKGSSALSKGDLAKKADAVCVTYAKKAKSLKDPTDAASALAYFDKALPIFADQRKALGDLKADDSVKAEWDALLADYDAQIVLVKKAQTILKSGDEAGFAAIGDQITKSSDASDKKLDAFGAVHCGTKSDEV